MDTSIMPFFGWKFFFRLSILWPNGHFCLVSISFSAFAVYYPLTACMFDNDDVGGRQHWRLEEQTQTHNKHGGQWRVTCAWIFAIDQMAQLVTVLCPTALVQRTKTKQQQNERNEKHKQATHRLIDLIATLVKYAPVRSFLMDNFDWVKWLCAFFYSSSLFHNS